MPGYKHPCRYCNGLVENNTSVCPFCGKYNPLGPDRCPKCRNPIEKGMMKCSGCGISLEVQCPNCDESTYFGDHCDKCGERLVVICPRKKCKTEQPPIEGKCIKCGKPLKIGR
ncbi:MAG: hypothetical protein FP824_01620 [Euryarchaeota archaeon]|nr:hypothetical protein [Euryarchaeota archaeon]